VSSGKPLEKFKPDAEMIQTYALKRALWLLCGKQGTKSNSEAGRPVRK
jgi:hypothetical protein